MRSSRRQAQTSPLPGSSITSMRHAWSSTSSTQFWWRSGGGSSPESRRRTSPSPTTWRSYAANASRTAGKCGRGMPISRSSCSRVCAPTKRSTAHPPTTHQGTSSASSRSAASVGVHARRASSPGPSQCVGLAGAPVIASQPRGARRCRQGPPIEPAGLRGVIRQMYALSSCGWAPDGARPSWRTACNGRGSDDRGGRDPDDGSRSVLTQRGSASPTQPTGCIPGRDPP